MAGVKIRGKPGKPRVAGVKIRGKTGIPRVLGEEHLLDSGTVVVGVKTQVNLHFCMRNSLITDLSLYPISPKKQYCQSKRAETGVLKPTGTRLTLNLI